MSEGLAPLDLERLTRWAIEGRYPDDFEEATTTDAEAAVATASAVLLLAETAVSQALPEGPALQRRADPQLPFPEQQRDEQDLGWAAHGEPID
ncbi:MAG: hypothetical protein ACRD0K_02355 [Egibacteraceae bacterium]